MKALDQMASSMDQMLAGLQRTAGMPDEKAQALMKEMLAFKEQLEKVKAEQERTAGETEKVRAEYRKKLQDRTKASEQEVKRLEELAGEARRDVDRAQPGITYRSELEYEQSRESLSDLERALGMKELGAAWESAQRAPPSVERLSRYLEEDAALDGETPSWCGATSSKVDRGARGGGPGRAEDPRDPRRALARCSPTRARSCRPRRSSSSASSRRSRASSSRRRRELQQKLARARAAGADLPAGRAEPARRVARPHGRGGGGAREPQPAARPRRAGAGARRARALPEGARGGGQEEPGQGRRRRDGLPVPVRRTPAAARRWATDARRRARR